MSVFRYDNLDKVKSAPAKKNTKRWCRGKVGVEHLFVVTERHTKLWMKLSYIIKRCSACGKKRFEGVKDAIK